MLRFLLEGHGYKVEEAQHGAEALLKARQSPPELVISDLLMPVMDGYTLLRHWKSDQQLKHVPFIVYTATYTEPKDEKLALDLGADAFIVKPTEPEPFLNQIKEVLAKQKSGLLSPTKLPICDEQTQIKQYNESLIRKLEEKALQLEQANHALQLDIAERKRTEEALHQSTSLLQTAFDATADGILAVDRKGKIIAFNQRFTEMWRIPKALMEETNYHQLLKYVIEELKDKDGFLAEVEALYNQPEKEGWDIIEFKDGRVFERFSKPQRIGNEIVGRVWDFRDITDHRHTEAEREKLQAQFIQAQKMESVGRLAGGVAHDFNNMLGIIIGYSELALDTAGLPVTLHNHLEEIHNAANRAAEITKKLLAFARKQTISPRVLDLNETVESMLKMLRRLIGEDIDLAWLPGSALWPVMADPSQIDQILANLCVNARDAIAGAGKLTIETDKVNLDDTYCAEHADCLPGDYVMLAVSDDGCGMTPEIIAHLFEPFLLPRKWEKAQDSAWPPYMVLSSRTMALSMSTVNREKERLSRFTFLVTRENRKLQHPRILNKSLAAKAKLYWL